MNALIQPTASMTSRDMAALVEKRHDNVKRTIETLANTGVIRLPQIEEAENINNLGLPQKSSHYVFTGEQGKRDSIVVVAQLSPKFTARLVDRWMELETAARHPPALPQTLPEALRLAADLTEQKQALEHTIAKQAPKVEGFDIIANAEGLICLRDAAANLKLRQTDFIRWMVLKDWLYRKDDACGLRGHAKVRKKGWLEHKHFTYTNRNTGLTETRAQVCVTPLGLTVLARKLPAIRQDIAAMSDPPLP